MISLPNKIGLKDYLRSIGWLMRERDGLCMAKDIDGVEDDVRFQADVNAYNELPAIKQIKILEIKREGLIRVQLVFPTINDLDDLRLITNIIQSIAPAARQLTQPISQLAAIWQAAQNAIQAVNVAGDALTVAAVTPIWP